MKNLIIILFVVLSFCITYDTTNAQWPAVVQPQRPAIQFQYQPRVYYYPNIVWLPQGTTLSVGGVRCDPYRRNVTFGINYGFYSIPQVQTFNFYTGQYGR